MERLLKLPERLSVIAGYIQTDASVADVGSDHGLLPVYLAQNGIAHGIIASDISENSLSSARRSAEKYGVTDKISFIITPGLDGITPSQIDTVIIAGMGGETIIGIIADAPWLRKSGARLILQPQSKTDKLCVWLSANGYAINDASITLDNGRFYIVMLVSAADNLNCSSDPEMALYSLLVQKRDPLAQSFLDSLIDKSRSASDGFAKSGAGKNMHLAKRLDALIKLKEEAAK